MARPVIYGAARAAPEEQADFTHEDRIRWMELMTVPAMRRALYREPKSCVLELLMPSSCPAECVLGLGMAMGTTPKVLAHWLELSTPTAGRDALPLCDAEKLLGLARLIGQVDEAVAGWCDASSFFVSGMWLRHWLRARSSLPGRKARWMYLSLAAGRDGLAELLRCERIKDIRIRPRPAELLAMPPSLNRPVVTRGCL
jgi:hypothetical protein